ncbi:FYVE zinc finger protein [Xylariaceae sp. FL0594]|nr:FYVE zinc finger protein [Xylariaceae sp. FL0594]
MAPDLIMPRLADSQSPHYAQYQPQMYTNAQQSTAYAPQPVGQGYHSQQVSPLSTSNNGSPTSPKPYNRQRLRPLFIPAVLRPTERPYKYGPKHEGEASEQGQGQPQGHDDDRPMSSASSFISLPGLRAWSGRKRPGETGKDSDGEWDLDLFPKPTAPPTRKHWKPDLKATVCDELSCLRHFNTWNRRHHCRRCGNIFCDVHSAFTVPLDQDANYNPRGMRSRACGHCYSEFQGWCSRTNSQGSSQGSSDDASLPPGPQTAPSSPIITTPTGIKLPPPHPAEVAMSVPRDWNWSTF